MKERTYQAIGHIRIDKLQPHHLLDFYKQLGEPGMNQRTGGGLSPKTILHYHTFISSILERAVKWQMIRENPCHRVDVYKRQDLDGMYFNMLVAGFLEHTGEAQE